MVYLDEAGISSPTHEPFVVVAGVVIHADRQWKMIEQYLSDMADHYVPPAKRHGFVFHATELFSGGKTFPRQDWPREKRWEILDALIDIPKKFKLPIACGFVERAKVAAKYSDLSVAKQTIHAQTISFAICCYAVEYFLTHGHAVEPNEVALIVMENNDQARDQIRKFHKFNRDPANEKLLSTLQFGKLVLTRVVDTVHFAEKSYSSPLQIADICAFAIKRHLMKKPESNRFYQPLKAGLVLLPKEEIPHFDLPPAEGQAFEH
ncbi:MAG: hypothetical protein QOD40_2065 [Alphaproteobacteria bacterium]|nr:hypothetical protein [Alphaproteobacteria bacterium]